MDLNMYLRGGGTRFPAYIGALRRIEEQGGRVVAWSGVSAGGLLAAVLACGYSYSRAMDLAIATDLRQFLDFRPTGVLRRYGIYSGDRLEKWLGEVTEGRCFADLDVPLSITAMDIEAGEPYFFTAARTPDVSLAKAIRCSVSIPGLFAVNKLNGHVLIDGGLAEADESELFPDAGRPCVTMRLVRDRAPQREDRKFGLGIYIRRLAELLFDAVDNARVPAESWKQTLLIKTGEYAAFDFELTAEDKQAMHDMGYQQCGEYLDLNAIGSGRPSCDG